MSDRVVDWWVTRGLLQVVSLDKFVMENADASEVDRECVSCVTTMCTIASTY